LDFGGVHKNLWIGIQADYELEIARLHCEKRIERDARALPGFQRVFNG
jgi:hypothetical protein